MKKAIYILCIWFGAFSGIAQQVNVAPSFILNQLVSENVEYKARDFVRFENGFRYCASNGNSLRAHIDPNLLFPPTTGTTGGPELNDKGIVHLFEGNFGVAPSGAATYSVPLDLPQGINGCQPTLSLNYNSTGSLGIMGEGWSIGGISCIEIVPSTYSYDGYVQAVQLNQGDPLVLDGKLLKWVDEASGKLKFEDDNQTMVVAINPNNLSLGFTVFHPDGTKILYGQNENSRYYLQSNSSPIAWYIQKVENIDGNSYTYSYSNDMIDGGFYPIDIQYTSNLSQNISATFKVEFHYTYWYNPPKKYFRYISNVSNYSRITKLLDSISISNVQCNSLLEGYKLYYTCSQVEFVNHPQLSLIYRRGPNGLQTNPIKFRYNEYETSDKLYKCSQDLSNKNGVVVDPINIDNNGHTDLAIKYVRGAGGSGYEKALQIYRNTTTVNSENGSLNTGFMLLSTIDLTYTVAQLNHCVSGDFNGDNITEFLQIYKFNSQNTGGFIGHLNSLNQYVEGENCFPAYFPAINDPFEVICADFSGDGALDLAFFINENQNGMKVQFLLQDPATSTFSTIVSINNLNLGHLDASNSSNRILVGDYYGDGKASVLYCPGDPGIPSAEYSYLIKLNNANDMILLDRFESISDDDLYENLLSGDFNGDSKTDIVRLFKSGTTCQLDFLLSNGTGAFIENGPYNLPGAGSNWTNFGISTADFNEDGCTDLSLVYKSDELIIMPYNAYYKYYRRDVFLNLTGMNTLRYKVVDFIQHIDTCDYNYAFSKPSSCFGNFTGLNNHTMFTVTGNHLNDPGQEFVITDYTKNTANRGLTTIVNSFGDSIQLTYKPFTFDNLPPVAYSSDTFPLRPDFSARNVVSKIRRNYGGNQFDSKVLYETGWVHSLGKGFLGFNTVSIQNLAEGTAVTDYNTVVRPFYSAVNSKTVHSIKVNGNYTNSTIKERRYDFTQTGTGKAWRYRSDLTQLIEKNFTETGYLFNTKRIAYEEFDSYGFAHKVISSYSIDQTTFSHFEQHAIGYHHILNNDVMILGLQDYDSVKHILTGTSDVKRVTNFQYYPNSAKVQAITLNAGTLFQSVVSYTYDAFGNIKSSVKACSGFPSRTDSTIYSNDGRFLVRTRNALNHQTSYLYDVVTGNLTSTIDANGLKTCFFYDPFRVLEKTTFPDGRNSVFVTRWVDESIREAPSDALYYSWEKTSGGPLKKVFYNKRKQALRECSVGANSKVICKDFEYSYSAPTAGLLLRESNPYFADNGNGWPIENSIELYWTNYTYNSKREASKIIQPNGATMETTSYQRIYTTQDYNGTISRKEFDEAGWLIKVTDNNTEEVAYSYTADGKPERIVLNSNQTDAIRYSYNELGKVDTLQDPHIGTKTFLYSPFGEMTRVTNSRNQNTNTSYDKLGRPTVSSSPEGVARWYYDNPQNGIGLLDYSQFFPTGGEYGFLLKKNRYDSQCRLVRSTQGMDNDTLSFTYSYGLFGRLTKTTYPSGFTVLNHYDVNGFTSKISNICYGTIWELQSQNSFGSVCGAALGSLFNYAREYNPLTNRLIKNSVIRRLNSSKIYEGGYSWNMVGNMVRRTDSLRGLEETFHYTQLNQLDDTYLNGTNTAHVTYGGLGTFISRSDVGSYTYGEGNAGPQAVTRIQAAPGVFPAVDQVVQTYTSFDKIQELTEGSLSLKVLYDDAGQKLLQAITNNQTQETTTTLYQGFSEKVTTGSMVKTMDYIASPEGVVAIFTRNGNTDSTLHFLVKDYAGSIIGILNPDGTYAQELSYDAWGRRRNPTTWQPYIGTMPQALYTRGYTMHEHLANFGLIDMKGRVYDPLVGHFLSADPFIQAPEFSLSFNRYSYCLNNPLLYTDPTGFFAEGPDVDASGLSNNFDGSNDLGSANSGAETRCNTDRQTDPNWNDDGYIATWDGTKYVYEYLNDVGNLVGKDLYRYQGGLLDGSTAVYDQKTGECVDVLPPSQTSEIDPLTGRENLMPLVDANWIIDLATGLAGGIRAATSRTIARESVTVVDDVAAKSVTTADGFLFKGFTVKAPFNIPVQRFGNMSLTRPDFWGARIGTSKFANRTFAAIKPSWNPLTQYTKGVIPKGTPMKFGIVGPQGWRYPGGSFQFIIDSKSVINQSSKLIH
ncbi:MAG: FG-GAP-like repeat-containing protein [Bacteroidales bacterium]|nr:FG-GAP-like repeat-containing protein [Bacteroidales bacterium]MDD3665927.1 FG-GAP-like repeat-containing protein [Bacteroidales bacterium]